MRPYATHGDHMNPGLRRALITAALIAAAVTTAVLAMLAGMLIYGASLR